MGQPRAAGRAATGRLRPGLGTAGMQGAERHPSGRPETTAPAAVDGRLPPGSSWGDGSHVGGLGFPLALLDVDLDLLPLLQRAVPAGLDGAEVHEDVLALLGADEAIPLVSVEPFHRSNS